MRADAGTGSCVRAEGAAKGVVPSALASRAQGAALATPPVLASDPAPGTSVCRGPYPEAQVATACP